MTTKHTSECCEKCIAQNYAGKSHICPCHHTSEECTCKMFEKYGYCSQCLPTVDEFEELKRQGYAVKCPTCERLPFACKCPPTVDGAAAENAAWLKGERCERCGKEMTADLLTSVCDKCWKNN